MGDKKHTHSEGYNNTIIITLTNPDYFLLVPYYYMNNISISISIVSIIINVIMCTIIYTRFVNQGLRVRGADTVIL